MLRRRLCINRLIPELAYRLPAPNKEANLDQGITIALFGETGTGKTTQAGEYARWIRKNRKKNTRLYTSDLGGHLSIQPLVKLGVIEPVSLTPSDDPWIWINEAVEGKTLKDDTGLVVFDSGTSMGEALLTACHKSPVQIGQQKTQRFTVSSGSKSLSVSINNEAHYGVVQQFMLDNIWRSTWLTLKGIDVLWTFSLHRSEEQDRTQVLGPKLAGKALTAAMPKWFNYTWRTESIPVEGAAPVHRLYLQEYPEMAGMGHSFGNARYPLAASPLPPYIEPASIPVALDMINQGQEEALEKERLELGL